MLTSEKLSTCVCLYLIFFFSAGPNILDCADAFLFHSPFCKLVKKSVGRLMLNDFHNDPQPDYQHKYSGLEPYR